MSNESPLKGAVEVLQSIFENSNSPLAGSFLRWKLWRQWEDYVGSAIAKNCEPVGLKNGSLAVWVKSSTWMQQLIFMKEPMMEVINRKIGEKRIVNIHFTLDRYGVSHDEEKREETRATIDRISPNRSWPNKTVK
jgi:Dna[CI] antecedent, DciA